MIVVDGMRLNAYSNGIVVVVSLVQSMNLYLYPDRQWLMKVTRLKRSHHPVETSLLESPSASTSKETQLDQGQPQLQAISNVIIEQNDETELDSRSSTWGTAGLQPASILSKEAQSGKFSLENILCVPNALEPRHTAAPTGHSEARDDPIACHILTFPVALGLFER